MTEAILALEDGSIFRGQSIGVSGAGVGEVVFNTAMTGYQEILTDPSYARQLITLTYPHIGNTGVNDQDNESSRVWADGLIIRDLPLLASSWRMQMTLAEFLEAHAVVAIAGLDTRRLTRIIREQGAQSGCILAGEGTDEQAVDKALEQARNFPGLTGMDLARIVSTENAYEWDEGGWSLEGGFYPAAGSLSAAGARSAAGALSAAGARSAAGALSAAGARSAAGAQTPGRTAHHVVVFDFGVKRNILRMLVDRGCRVTVVPADTTSQEVFAIKPDGVMLSNGPGDPEPCRYAIETIEELIAASVPTFGICLGYQLLALASGAQTIKMSHGHHGANHPVKALASGRVVITSQNHGFAVNGEALPACLEGTHISLFDGSLQGIKRRDKPAFGFQGHPEASPGPHDVGHLFDEFVTMMERCSDGETMRSPGRK